MGCKFAILLAALALSLLVPPAAAALDEWETPVTNTVGLIAGGTIKVYLQHPEATFGQIGDSFHMSALLTAPPVSSPAITWTINHAHGCTTSSPATRTTSTGAAFVSSFDFDVNTTDSTCSISIRLSLNAGVGSTVIYDQQLTLGLSCSCTPRPVNADLQQYRTDGWFFSGPASNLIVQGGGNHTIPLAWTGVYGKGELAGGVTVAVQAIESDGECTITGTGGVSAVANGEFTSTAPRQMNLAANATYCSIRVQLTSGSAGSQVYSTFTHHVQRTTTQNLWAESLHPFLWLAILWFAVWRSDTAGPRYGIMILFALIGFIVVMLNGYDWSNGWRIGSMWAVALGIFVVGLLNRFGAKKPGTKPGDKPA